MATLYPRAVWKPVPSHSGPLSSHLGLVVHVQVGDGSCYGEFSNPNNQASSTWWIAKDGTVEQYVDADLTAWTEMAGNPYYDSVETEGTPDEPLTPQQCQALAELIAWGHQTFGWPLALVDHGGIGITTHAHYPSGQPDPAWGDHPCPGPVRAGQLPDIVAAAQKMTGAPVPNEGDEDMQLYSLTDPTTGGTWVLCSDPGLPPGSVYTYDGAPMLGNTANQTVNPGNYPIAGFDLYTDTSGVGYTIVLDWGNRGDGHSSDGGDRFRRYHFPRSGSESKV